MPVSLHACVAQPGTAQRAGRARENSKLARWAIALSYPRWASARVLAIHRATPYAISTALVPSRIPCADKT